MTGPVTANLLAPVIALLLKNEGICRGSTWDELAEQISNKSLPTRHPLKLLADGFSTREVHFLWHSSHSCQAYLDSDTKISVLQELLNRYTDDTRDYAAKVGIITQHHHIPAGYNGQDCLICKPLSVSPALLACNMSSMETKQIEIAQVLELASCGLPLPSSLAFFLAVPLLKEARHIGECTPITNEGFMLLESISGGTALSPSVSSILGREED